MMRALLSLIEVLPLPRLAPTQAAVPSFGAPVSLPWIAPRDELADTEWGVRLIRQQFDCEVLPLVQE